MFECFTDRARKVMNLAQLEAYELNREYVGTEHILLGLVNEGHGVAGFLLKSLGVNCDTIREKAGGLIDTWPESVDQLEKPLTPRAKQTIVYAEQESKNLKHNYVGTEHLLLGLTREHGGIAAHVLLNLGLGFDKIRSEVLSLLGVEKETKEQPINSSKPVRNSLETQIEKLDLQKGDLVRIGYPDTLLTSSVSHMRRQLNQNYPGVAFLILPIGFDVEKLSLDDLREYRDHLNEKIYDLERKNNG